MKEISTIKQGSSLVANNYYMKCILLNKMIYQTIRQVCLVLVVGGVYERVSIVVCPEAESATWIANCLPRQ